jgi:outer membrane protein OmpA-like peptidoglycan-associated protein
VDGYEDSDGCPEPTPVVVQVVDAAGAPVPGAMVLLGGQLVEDGPALHEPGEVRLVAQASGYLTVERSVSIPPGPEHTIMVEVEPAIAVGGLRVVAVDADGRPLNDATAALVGGRSLSGLTAEGIPAGPVEVLVSAPGMRTVRAPAEVREGEVAEVRVQLERAKVEITKDRIDIADSVYFETNKDVIKAESFGLLDEVAEILNAHPELVKIRVEGHTDSRGSASYNLDLSRRRAASVVRYLVEQGVSASRLESEGFGESKPLKAEETPAAWTMNRRVDFFVVERSDD